MTQRTSSTSTSDKTRNNENAKPLQDRAVNIPVSVLKVVKLKATIESVDVEKRSVIFARKKGQSLELTFPQPRGREQIKVSNKAAKILGKKKLKLEELTAGSKVQLRYYPALSQVMELVIEKPAG